MTKTVLFLLALTAPLFYILDGFWPKFFVFDPVKLQEISKVSIAKYGDDLESLMPNLVRDLQKEYPNIIGDYDTNQFVFNVAGGATVCVTPALDSSSQVCRHRGG